MANITSTLTFIIDTNPNTHFSSELHVKSSGYKSPEKFNTDFFYFTDIKLEMIPNFRIFLAHTPLLILIQSNLQHYSFTTH